MKRLSLGQFQYVYVCLLALKRMFGQQRNLQQLQHGPYSMWHATTTAAATTAAAASQQVYQVPAPKVQSTTQSALG